MSNDRLKRYRDEQRDQRELDRQRVTLLVEAVKNGHWENIYYILTADGMPWEMALRRLTKLRAVPAVSQQAFSRAWMESKSVPLKVRNYSILCAALRVMLPPYTGPAVRLFRGACFNEVQRRQYSVSWTDDRSVAERFARDYSEMAHGSVILETSAPPAAIIGQMEYPGPLTDAEREEFLHEHPNAYSTNITINASSWLTAEG